MRKIKLVPKLKPRSVIVEVLFYDNKIISIILFNDLKPF